MRIYEFAVLAIILVLLLVGWELAANRGMTTLGVSICVVAGLTSVGYLVVVKIRPLLATRQHFRDALSRHGFEPLEEKPDKRFVTKLIRQFSAFDDFKLTLDDVTILESDTCVLFAGLYALSGRGLNFGYFLAGGFRLPGDKDFALQKSAEGKRAFSVDGEFTLTGLPMEVQNSLREFPYDFEFRDNIFLADFDSRLIRKENFGDSFDQMMNALLGIADSRS